MARFRRGRDPFWDDGVGARQTHHRERIESALAFGLAITACGLATAVWLRMLTAAAGLDLG